MIVTDTGVVLPPMVALSTLATKAPFLNPQNGKHYVLIQPINGSCFCLEDDADATLPTTTMVIKKVNDGIKFSDPA